MDGCDEHGRTVAPQQLAVGDWTQYGLSPTYPPSRMEGATDRWRRDYENAPVRLSVTARSGDDVWTVPLEFPVTRTTR